MLFRSGNQGVFADGQTKHVFEGQAPGESLSFDGVTLEVPADSKYYAKGVRLAGLDNERSDKNRGGENLAGANTPMVAYVAADGALAGIELCFVFQPGSIRVLPE